MAPKVMKTPNIIEIICYFMTEITKVIKQLHSFLIAYQILTTSAANILWFYNTFNSYFRVITIFDIKRY